MSSNIVLLYYCIMKEDVVKQSQKSIKDSNPDSVKNLFDASQNAERNDDENSKYIGTESDGAKTKLVARVKADTGYGFYDARGEKVLPAEYQWLKNDMYPNNGEFDYNFYLRKEGETNHLYYIDVDGAVDLGQVKDAIPLSEDLVAVCRRGAFYGIIDKKGDKVMDANKFGRIIGISKDGYKVCELERDIYGLVDDNGKVIDDGRQSYEYIVNPLSSLICCIDIEASGRVMIVRVDKNGALEYESSNLFLDHKSKVYVYNQVVITDCYLGLVNADYSSVDEQYVDSCKLWVGRFYVTRKGTFELGSPIRQYNKYVDFKNGVLIVSSDNNEQIVYYRYDHRIRNVHVSSQAAFFIAVEDHAVVFGKVKNTEVEFKQLIKYGNGFMVGIYDAITLGDNGDNMVIHYWIQRQGQKRVGHAIIIDSQGNIIKEDHFNQYEFLCGPFKDAYYYLEGGEMYIIQEGEEEGTVASNGLHAEMMWPLGLTKRFLIKKNNEYRIVSSFGAFLSEPFVLVPNLDMDSVCNSEYIPIVNEEGKFGRVDTNGKVIVPCEFTEIFDMK